MEVEPAGRNFEYFRFLCLQLVELVTATMTLLGQDFCVGQMGKKQCGKQRTSLIKKAESSSRRRAEE
jgi:hypothetical protein